MCLGLFHSTESANNRQTLEKTGGEKKCGTVVFLVLEYVEGETLQARLSKGASPLEDALALCRQIEEGLEAAHEKGVIHRDLKPANATSDEPPDHALSVPSCAFCLYPLNICMSGRLPPLRGNLSLGSWWSTFSKSRASNHLKLLV
ncbi:MAG: protein kinase [Acidobacteria bacterium]|nr:protein kinase [Acidobacteriota bacterium]